MTQTLISTVFLVGLGALTGTAAVFDYRFRRIPNWLSLAGLVSGLLFQIAFHGLPGLLHGLAGFAVGFGTLFVLWMIGGGGGGDVKLMGALGAWLGFGPTVSVIIYSTLFVALGAVVYQLLRFVSAARGAVSTEESAPEREPAPANKSITVPFAIPVFLGTWLILLSLQWNFFLPLRFQ